MQEKYGSNEERYSEQDPGQSNSASSRLDAKKHYDGETSKPEYHHYAPDDEADRLLHAAWRWFSMRLHEASLLDVITAIATIIAVIVGIIAAFIYHGQLQEMRHTNDLTQQALNQSSQARTDSKNASDAAAKISTESLQATIDNFHREQRAWVGFSFVPGSITFTVGQPFSVPTLLINSGKTPAKNVEGNIVVGIFERDKPLQFSYSTGHANYRIAAGTIFPDGSIKESFEAVRHGEAKAEAIVIDKDLFDDLLSSKRLVIVHGIITYADIFGTHHWTRYCRVVSNPSLIPDDCVRYNQTDDN